MAKKTTISCDLCGNEASYADKKVLVAFDTEQTEGRSTKGYFEMVTMDICQTCIDKLIAAHPLRASGAMGHNTYTMKEIK